MTELIDHISVEKHSVKRRYRSNGDLSFVKFVDPGSRQVVALAIEHRILDIRPKVVRIEWYFQRIGEVDGVDIGWIDPRWEDGEVILADEDGCEFLLASEGLVGVEIKGICKEDHIFSLSVKAFVHVVQD